MIAQKLGMLTVTLGVLFGAANASAAQCSPEIIRSWSAGNGFMSAVTLRQKGQELELTGWMGGEFLSAKWSNSQIRGWVGNQPLSIRFKQEANGRTKANGWLGLAGNGLLTWKPEVTKKKENRILIGGTTDRGMVSVTFWGKSPKNPNDRSINGWTRRNDNISLHGRQKGDLIELNGSKGFGIGDMYDLDIDTCSDKKATLRSIAFSNGEKITISQALMALALVND